MTNVEALKALYAALGGDAADVANASTSVEVLNAIAAKYEGADDATTNAEAIANITAVLDNIIPEPTADLNAKFGSEPESFTMPSNLIEITIPDGITTIGAKAFNGCTKLNTITIHAPEGSITGAPWGAPSTTRVVWIG